MDGIHDVGGMDGMGPVEPEDTDRFTARWEETVFALLITSLVNRTFNIDEFRHAIERMDPAEYLSSSYYEHWLSGLERLMLEKGVLASDRLRRAREEVASGERSLPSVTLPELRERVLEAARTGASTRRDGPDPRFAPGDPVRVRTMHPPGHTRCPRYVRRAHGEIDRVHGSFVCPDSHAHGQGEDPEAVYSVRFEGEELWGETEAEPGQVLYIDLWERYLQPSRSP